MGMLADPPYCQTVPDFPEQSIFWSKEPSATIDHRQLANSFNQRCWEQEAVLVVVPQTLRRCFLRRGSIFYAGRPLSKGGDFNAYICSAATPTIIVKLVSLILLLLHCALVSRLCHMFSHYYSFTIISLSIIVGIIKHEYIRIDIATLLIVTVDCFFYQVWI